MPDEETVPVREHRDRDTCVTSRNSHAKDTRGRPFIHRWRSAVFNSDLPSLARLALLALAEYADSAGGSCHPSVDSIADITGMNEKTVRRMLQLAASQGWIARLGRQGVGQAWRQWSYTLVLPAAANTVSARERKRAGPVSAPSAETCGLTVKSVQAPSPERAGAVPDELALDLEKERTGRAPNNGKEKRLTLKAWLDDEDDDPEVLPPQHPIRAYIKKIGLPQDFMWLAWNEFERRHLDSPKRLANWRSTFQAWVERNYMGLWCVRGGEYVLTTAGQQAARAHDMARIASVSRSK